MNQGRDEDVKKRLAYAKRTMGEVDILVENHLWNTAVNRMYYACFYAVNALLIRHGMETKTHAGTQRLFGLNFIKTGKIDEQSGQFYSALFEMRQDADYEFEVEYDKDDVMQLIGPATRLINEIDQLLSHD
jgi:uncharacterized protein (UPF0332 family)